ncbi:MAG TPA: MarR family winged helix-turn-helix transcriptional regulator [Dermatophilaceae bacterium]|nr:MarR family winged helix-turn-helix transcriptional regulator [Dermatophilaceae bacterium]
MLEGRGGTPADDAGSGQGVAHEAHTDDVDRIVAAWRRELPQLDVEPLHILSRITRLARRLDLLRGAAFAEHDLEGWEFDVLSALRRAGEPYELSPGRLVTDTLVTSGTMTNRVNRLVRRGLVTRHTDPHDRRGALVRLTGEGRRVADAAITDLVTREHALLDALPVAERTVLADLLRRLSTPLEG